jgi:hypothetical protein
VVVVVHQLTLVVVAQVGYLQDQLLYRQALLTQLRLVLVAQELQQVQGQQMLLAVLILYFPPLLQQLAAVVLVVTMVLQG